MRANDRYGIGGSSSSLVDRRAIGLVERINDIRDARSVTPSAPGIRKTIVPWPPNALSTIEAINGPAAHPELPPTVYIESEMFRARGSLTRAAFEAPNGGYAPDPIPAHAANPSRIQYEVAKP